MKYHYFHGRFTYSVKRSGPAAGGGRSRFSLRAIAVLDSCVEACAVSEAGWRRGGVAPSGRFGGVAVSKPWLFCCDRGVGGSVPHRRSFADGSLFGDAIRAEDIAGWGV